jgi:soluble lytic murein transglycosylase
MELAASADSPFRALRIMKSFSGDYLSLPLEKASPKFWQMLFPLPYKDAVFESARSRGLDPYYVAGLIRQESEFNPVAKSPASALGLMQLMPATGRMLGRKDGMGPVTTSLLFNPSVSIRLGTQYLRGQLDSWDGDWYRTLAAYNAGPGRVHQWLAWANFKEPVEFIESIPFTETREYIQAVLRNADIYRSLYAGAKPLAPLPIETLLKVPEPYHPAALPKPAATAVPKPAAAKKTTGTTRKPGSKKAVAAKSGTPKKHHPA